MIIQSVGNIFGQGAPSYISRCLGGKKYEEVKRTSSVSAYIAVSITLILTAVYFAFRTPVLSVLGTSENNIGPTRDYLNIIIGFGFVMTLQVALPAFLRAEGKVKGASIGAALGIVINIIGVASKMISMAFMLVLGYVSGYAPFAGYNYGAKNYERMLSALKFVMISSTCICIVFLLPFIFLSRAFMGAFTPEEEIIGTGVQFLHAYAWCLPILGLQISLMCTFQAAGMRSENCWQKNTGFPSMTMRSLRSV